jgi:hypothetical protein
VAEPTGAYVAVAEAVRRADAAEARAQAAERERDVALAERRAADLAAERLRSELGVLRLALRQVSGAPSRADACLSAWQVTSAWTTGTVFCSKRKGHDGGHEGVYDGDLWRKDGPRANCDYTEGVNDV